MQKYIVLANWTDQGMKNVKDSPARVDAARALAKSMGATMGDFYMTVGSVDVVFMMEAPSDEVMAKFSLTLASKGNVRTTTLKAFSEADFRKITASV